MPKSSSKTSKSKSFVDVDDELFGEVTDSEMCAMADSIRDFYPKEDIKVTGTAIKSKHASAGEPVDPSLERHAFYLNQAVKTTSFQSSVSGACKLCLNTS